MFYTRRVVGDDGGHVIRKNLSLVKSLGAPADRLTFPLNVPAPPVIGEAPFAMLNPGAGWPNKQWPRDRFGAIAAHLRRRYGLTSLVLWGPGERDRAEQVVAASEGAARVAPATTIADLLAIARAATLFVAGDTGPMQLAAAVGTPIVGVFGPTNPSRNGPWDPADVCLSRFDECECHHKRRCRRATPCIESITTAEVTAAIDRRLEGRVPRG
jgi:ADP-heptose:LPS heptosyltransferase